MTARKKTVLFITGTRAEWGFMQSAVLRLSKSPFIKVKVLVTGMHTQRRFGYTLSEVRKAIHVDHVVPVQDYDDQMTALGKEVDGIGRYLKRHPADALLVVGDRDEAFAGSTAGVHLGIPVIHVSGGDVSGPIVDQYLRNAITCFSRVHLVQTSQSRENVLALGADPRLAKIVGSAGLDGLTASSLMRRKDVARHLGLDPDQRWFLVLMHPTILDNAPIPRQIQSVLQALRTLRPNDEKIILYPNADEGSDSFIRAIEKTRGTHHYHLLRHLPRMEFLSLMHASAALIGNSSSGLVEAGHLRVPFVHIGNRQQHREHGSNVLFSGYDADAIVQTIDKVLSPAFRRKMLKHPSPYRGGAVAARMIQTVEQFVQSL
ncbi:MAG: UDP-N-acetyl-D-glucosamine 2-epimerase, UDP-hydrolysing [Candidatus Peregrinibacteria bacterium Greene0416_62]|nr:MAG: UDP-N-acetyl-D-glucosamine 2-epimerase, UDP-hydrolysing [Candidatus Peregrinibacteria bacterium Greene0416_62]TSC97263.1 MAG: UDP-N-acetyl-D-glucosamine 2-epimerase, UDP-hydrolysing [Candidatus Peregrinibacteria bacterium Greene1014_49]